MKIPDEEPLATPGVLKGYLSIKDKISLADEMKNPTGD
jgi:hypothetical protein